MENPILNDPVYLRFYTALKHMLATTWHRRQTTLAEEIGISKSFMSEVVKGKKKLTFEKRNKVATVCGFSYDDFILLGKDILENPNNQSKPIPLDPAVQILHEAMDETGIKINEKQRKACLKLIREELTKSDSKMKNDIKKYLKAFGE